MSDDLIIEEDTCSNCVFYKGDVGQPTQGRCRHDPPKEFMVQGQNALGQGQVRTISSQPTTPVDGWCSKHEPGERRGK